MDKSKVSSAKDRKNEITDKPNGELDWAYVAGLLEGEGTFSIGRRRTQPSKLPSYHPILVIAMCDREPIEFISRMWDSSVTSTHFGRRKGWKRVYRTHCPTSRIGYVLENIRTHLRSARHRNQALLLQKALDLLPGSGRTRDLARLKYQNWVWEQMQILKYGTHQSLKKYMRVV